MSRSAGARPSVPTPALRDEPAREVTAPGPAPIRWTLENEPVTMPSPTDTNCGCLLEARGDQSRRKSASPRHADAVTPEPSLRLVTSGLGVVLLTAHRRFDALLDAIAACGEGNHFTWIE